MGKPNFSDEFTREINRLRRQAGKATSGARAEVTHIDRDLDRLVDKSLAGGNANKINRRMLKMEAWKRDPEVQVSQAQEPGSSGQLSSEWSQTSAGNEKM